MTELAPDERRNALERILGGLARIELELGAADPEVHDELLETLEQLQERFREELEELELDD